MKYNNIIDELEVYVSEYLAGRLYAEGLIEGFGFVLYGNQFSLVPVFATGTPDKDKLRAKVEDICRKIADSEAKYAA